MARSIDEIVEYFRNMPAEEFKKLNDEVMSTYDYFCQNCGSGLDEDLSELYDQGYCDGSCKEIHKLKEENKYLRDLVTNNDIILCFKKAERVLRDYLKHWFTVSEYVWFSVRVVEDADCYECSVITIDYEFENPQGGLDNPTLTGNINMKLQQWRLL